MPEIKPERTCHVTCERCRASANYVYELVDGREPDSAELHDQLRERYGLMFNAYFFPPQAKVYCPDCGPVVARELMEAHNSPPAPAESPTAPTVEQQESLW